MNGIYKYTVGRIEKNRDVVFLDIFPKEGEVFDFKAGQFIMLALYDEDGEVYDKRPFSICSSPLNKKFIQLAIKIEGEFTNKVATLKEGDFVGVVGPSGFFVFNETRMKDVVFFAGGIGVAPFVSAIRYISDKKLENNVILFYSNKTKEDIAFFDELKLISKELKNIQVVFTISDDISESWGYEKGRIDEDMIKKYSPDFVGKYFSLCGPISFMNAMIAILKKNGVADEHIDMERFK